MRVKTSEATDRQLNWTIATKIEGVSYANWRTDGPANDWSEGGPIIEQEEIAVRRTHEDSGWTASKHVAPATVFEEGSTPLIAAMRCYVASKLGDEIEIPKEFN